MRSAPPILALLLAPFTCAAGAEPADVPESWPAPVMSGEVYGMLLVDRLEAGFADGADPWRWDLRASRSDGERFWRLETEGEGERGGVGHAEVRLLYSRTFAPFWEWQAGVRHDFRPDPSRSHVIVGIRGTAPYEIGIESSLFVSDTGDASVRIEAEYDLNLTQRLVLHPRIELNAAFTEDPAIGQGSGVTATEAGLRLRYEIRRELAPYLGIAWTQRHGETADLARARGEDDSVAAVVFGIRAWF